MILGHESGHIGEVESLAGVKGKYGLEMKGAYGVSLTVDQNASLLESNGKRVWAMIENTGDNRFYIAFGATPVGGDGPVLEIYPKGVFQIDKNIPWTGDVRAWIGVGDPATTLAWTECSVA